MAYIPELETGETLVLKLAFQVSMRDMPFNFVVSNRAIYWPSTKTFAIDDAAYFKRIQNGEVVEVSVRRLPPYGLWMLAPLAVLVSAIIGYYIFTQAVIQESDKKIFYHYVLPIIVAGVLMPFAAKGRLGLEIKTHDNVYLWEAPLVFGSSARKKIQTMLDEVLDACKKSGIKTTQS
jgi:hypothetical protein